VKTYLVTGGAGFIGSNFVLGERSRGEARIVNLDFLTYAGNLMNLKSLVGDPEYVFEKGDIGDRDRVRGILEQYHPCAIINFAAESHVDRSIDGPEDFIQTNVVGTFHLLEEVRNYWNGLSGEEKIAFRFLHVSTDEVYGSLGQDDQPFREETPYAPNSPYSASKASSDHLVRAYYHTYGLPTFTTNCSNNYGPRQFPEKLIPLVLLNAEQGKSLPIYGDGLNVRDWLYVEDHCKALSIVLKRGRVGEVFNIGGHCERTNLEIVKTICSILDELLPESPYRPHESLITFVKDRPGHDRRYAIDSSKIENELGWRRVESFESGLRKTIEWYFENRVWVDSVQTGEYREWISRQYGVGRKR
jgi:dTDP-glucose 4,6-dehydratase